MTNLHTSTEEIWKDIPGYEGHYQASSEGRIRSLNRYLPYGNHWRKVTGKLIKPYPNKAGYLIVDFYTKKLSVHRLILRTFAGECPNDMEVCMHLNDNKTDNRAVNLKWGTYSDNNFMAFATGRHVPYQRCKGL